MIDLPALAARDDLKANAVFGQHSSAIVFTVDPGATVLTKWSWNIVSAVYSASGVYIINFNPFDFTGTTYPLFVQATVGRQSDAAGSILFATYSVTNATQIKVYTWLHTGAATELATTDVCSVLITGRRNRPTSNGSTVIDPAKNLLRANYNLGVTGL